MTRNTVSLCEPMPVVCGGGARRGAYQIGLFRLIEEIELPVSYFMGISIGSYTAALYTNGKTPDKIGEILKNELFRYGVFAWSNPKNWLHSFKNDPLTDEAVWINWIKVLCPTINPWRLVGLGIMNTVPALRALVQRHDLKPQPNLRIVAFDLKRLKPIIFGGPFKGTTDKAIYVGPEYDLAIALAGSSCVAGPGLMKPVACSIDGSSYLLVDGGFYHPHPGKLTESRAIIAKLIDVPTLLFPDRAGDVLVSLGGDSREPFFARMTAEDVQRMDDLGYARARSAFITYGLLPRDS